MRERPRSNETDRGKIGTIDGGMSATEQNRIAFDAAFKAHERHLWGILYRMTGCAADADDLIQETFQRALERPPARIDDPLRPWLVKVAVNLGRDHLRKRKRQPYTGPWLPSPIEAIEEEAPPAFETQTTEARYDLLESVTFAFLLALEALTPSQRAVMILRDVFDYAVREVSDALGMSEANVKTTHHRARTAMAAYEAKSRRVTPELRAETMRVLTEFFTHLAAEDVPAIEAMLAADVRTKSDAGGEYNAALRTIVGPKKVRLFFERLTKKHGLPTWFDVRILNGLPAFMAEYASVRPRIANRFVVVPIIGDDGRIRELHIVLATRKLEKLRFGSDA
jgi:RNA polymerase sigma-70 factor (ECF subfamily)